MVTSRNMMDVIYAIANKDSSKRKRSHSSSYI